MPARRRSGAKTSRPSLYFGEEPPWSAVHSAHVDARALLTPVLAQTFHELSVSVSLWLGKDWWYPIHVVGSTVTSFEFERAMIRQRWAYNRRCYAQAVRERRIVLGKHAGFYDLFLPILERGGVWGLIVAGPFATSRPTSAEVLQRWHELTGSQGRLDDPTFSHYLSATLDTLTLEGPELPAFERLLSCLADLVTGQGAPQDLAAEAQGLRRKVLSARFAERMWEATRRLVEERSEGLTSLQLPMLGLKHLPRHAIAGLLLGRKHETDPVDDLVRRSEFQRACVALAQRAGDSVCGQVGDHGITLLVDYDDSATRTRERLRDLASRAAVLARRFGLELHAGISQASDSTPVATRYRSALWAAEKALTQGLRVVYGEPLPEHSRDQLRKLRAKLAESIGDDPTLLPPRFDRYVEAVLAHAGYRLERVRAEFEAGVERLAEPLLASGFLDQKAYGDLFAAGERSAEQARTVTDLIASYRRVVSDIESALQGPTAARRERGTRHALDFIREHLSEPLSVTQVARVAGFAPDYFGRLFKRDEGVSFTHYVQQLRLRRAKQMLKETRLSVEQVQKLSGFRVRTYFHQLFKEAEGMTPIEYRRRAP